MIKTLSTVLLVILLSVVCKAQGSEKSFTLPSILSSNMVLQQGQAVPVWGKAAPGESIKVVFDKKRWSTRAAKDGSWKVMLPAMNADGKSHTLTISTRDTMVVYSNVAVGEVWLCSGQSNMAYQMRLPKQFALPKKGTDLAAEELQKPVNGNIRVFVSDRRHRRGAWHEASGESLPNVSAIGYFFGKKIQEELDVPVGIITMAVGGTRIETWTPKDAYDGHPVFANVMEQNGGRIRGVAPGDLYNRMIKPIVPFGIKGFLWYQGENNCGIDDRLYAEKFQIMAKCWRNDFGLQDAPFYYVLLAPHIYSDRMHRNADHATTQESLPLFQENQMEAQKLIPNSEYIVVSDLVDDLRDIHPSYKWEVGARLARVALAKTYAQDSVVWSGPRFRESRRAGNAIIVDFDHCGDGLKTGDGKLVGWFEVSADGNAFRPAIAEIIGKDQVRAYHPDVTAPRYIRLGWHETAMPNLVNSEGLPACPFRSVIEDKTTANIELPTMGWSSWNTYHVNISDSLIMRQADACVALGLKDAGYKYINIDDGFFGGRDERTGRLLIHPTRFPKGLKPVADHIHSLGLKAGIYSDAGANTCGCKYDNDTIAKGVGFYGHDQLDADMYFKELGFDFIKIDFCGGSSTGNHDYLSLDPRERYTAIRQAILNTGRTDVRMNVCRWDYPGTWVSSVAQSWRMSRDIRPRWSSVRDIIKQNLYLSAYAGGGHYNDMDMLEVGRTLSAEEDHTHFALWCMMASPLLIGCDLTTLKPATQKLITNKELISLNQDPLGLQAYVAKHDMEKGTYVLVKDIIELGGTTRAVVLYNPTDEPKEISIDYADIELGGDVMSKECISSGDKEKTKSSKKSKLSKGSGSTALSALIPAHGCRIYKLTATKRLPRTLYEAETAYLSGYQELYNAEATGTAYYAEDKLCRGGMKVKNLGYRPDNDLQWRNVYCQEAGEYEITIFCPIFSDKAELYVSINNGAGLYFKIKDMVDNKITFTVNMPKGKNTIRLYNDHGAMPEIDYMNITKK